MSIPSIIINKINYTNILIDILFAKKVKESLEKENIAKLNIYKINRYTIDKFNKKLRDTNHPSGGMIISKTKKEGIVDKNFCVWGTNNLFILGKRLINLKKYGITIFT